MESIELWTKAIETGTIGSVAVMVSYILYKVVTKVWVDSKKREETIRKNAQKREDDIIERAEKRKNEDEGKEQNQTNIKPIGGKKCPKNS